MGTPTARSRTAIYAAFLDLVGYLQLLLVASSAWYTNNCLWHNTKGYRLYTNC